MKAQLNLPMVDLSNLMEMIGKNLDGILPSRLDMLNGKQVLFTNNNVIMKPIGGWDVTLAYDDVKINRLERIDVPACVVAVDSSCILVGETIDGSIYSAKCSIALSCNGEPITHILIGPLLFYTQYCDYSKSMEIDGVKRMIRVRLERLVQYELARTMRGIIMLVDGSLRHSIHESLYTIHRIEDACRANGNMLIGLSKSTRLRHLEGVISLLSREMYPCYIDVSSMVYGDGDGVCFDGKMLDMGSEHCIDCNGKGIVAVEEREGGEVDGEGGRGYGCYSNNCSYTGCSASVRAETKASRASLLAKLAVNGLVLRADVLDKPETSLGMLMANDTLHNGYPESLRIAHHTSVFTRTDMLCIKGFMKSRFNIREVDGDDIRRALLGKI
ncbi:MAG: DNA double-strand break repair nuclease NurA [Candidatus Nitrosocaldus sp.]